MNYKESKTILRKVNKAKSILLNCHRGPDPDSIGSALALASVLKNMGKQVDVVCPSEELYEAVDYLVGYEDIKRNVDFSKFNYSNYELFICLDSSSWGMVTGDDKFSIPDISIVVIDHHHTNTKYGKLNLVDKDISSEGELVYRLFEDWNVAVDKSIATALLTAVVGDTGGFRYSNVTAKTFEVAQKLMEYGADKNMIITRIYADVEFNILKFWGEVLSNIKYDKEGKFIWSAIPFETFEKYGKPTTGKETAASSFAPMVKGTSFGFVAVEQAKDLLSISFRGRDDFDTSLIAKKLGGGGHKVASGAKVEGLPFDKAVEKVLTTIRSHTSES
jgi:bifunctional oligoribonuclease and PAP phosphatase NrnA